MLCALDEWRMDGGFVKSLRHIANLLISFPIIADQSQAYACFDWKKMIEWQIILGGQRHPIPGYTRQCWILLLRPAKILYHYMHSYFIIWPDCGPANVHWLDFAIVTADNAGYL